MAVHRLQDRFAATEEDQVLLHDVDVVAVGVRRRDSQRRIWPSAGARLRIAASKLTPSSRTSSCSSPPARIPSRAVGQCRGRSSRAVVGYCASQGAVNEEFLTSAGIDAQTMTLGSNGAIKQAARAGLGVSFVSRAAVATELEAGLLSVIDVASGPAPRDWYVMRSSVGPSRPVVTEFLVFITSSSARSVLEA